ncbi:hypothetical protein A2397_03425 [Candidatus Amesbacteria bacterium RIFOXYB1_FULL_44_23]|uniref:Uncharacterized protein n=1 Tax=Candidatus Amesbacteria bacterium RIFOXYB1_FULL_44_23 TaxID=1797263 RepID=A0A1F4ZUW7_9BACT|nr:MAG: hypothetical protein A2397_03425 [Candidatus Amesbacteria bacterium RIFOXYB1_FULL_44_23]
MEKDLLTQFMELSTYYKCALSAIGLTVGGLLWQLRRVGKDAVKTLTAMHPDDPSRRHNPSVSIDELRHNLTHPND